MWIRARVNRSRTRYGKVVMLASKDGSTLRPPCPVAAASDPDNATRLGNPDNDPFLPGGPPPFGRYRLGRVLSTHDLPADVRAEYGPVVLAFEPLSGHAATAESHGRLLLVVHGGETGGDGRLRRTTGGLRLLDADIRALAALARDAPGDVTLALEPMFAVWALWRRTLSRVGARPVPPPVPGVWGIARPRRRARGDDADADDSGPIESSTQQDSGDGPAAMRPGGGAFGGGGASGSFEDAPTTKPGTSASPDAGRAAGAIALGATLGALAAQAAAHPESHSDPVASSGESDSGAGAGPAPTAY
jgi:hypothetical protein